MGIIRRWLKIFAVLAFLAYRQSVFAVTYPTPTGYVNDYAHVLSNEAVSRIEQNLSQYAQSTTNEIAVVTIDTLEGEPIEDYAVRLFEQWSIGQEKKDNGVLLLVSKNDREVRIEVGYGLEPVITDARAGDIIRSTIIPAFRENRYDEGIENAVAAIQKLTSGEPLPTPIPSQPTGGGDISSLIVFGFVFFNILASYVGGFLGRTKETWPGGVIGGILGLMMGTFFATLAVGIVGAVVFGLFGLLLDTVLSKNYKERVKRGLPTNFGSSWGGFSGGSHSSGGFGGFGGGRSGGGGASGRW